MERTNLCDGARKQTDTPQALPVAGAIIGSAKQAMRR
jgi:hypothetical protein